MQEGILVEWRVKPGDRVKRRDVIAVVETDKAAIEIEVFEDGIVREILVPPGRKVPVGTVLAVIQTEDGQGAVSSKEEKFPVAGVSPAETGIEGKVLLEADALPVPASATSTQRIKASPYARRLAGERTIDLSCLKGTGPGGIINATDVETAAATVKTTPLSQPHNSSATEKPAVRDYPAAMRRAIATAMARSNREIPHYYLQTRIDMSRILRWLESENLKRSIKERILPVVPLIKAVALALGDVPELNGYWLEDRHQPQEAINIGFAIALRQGGLITPAILNADLKNLDELMASLRDLITRARSRGLRSSEMTEATVTVTSLGDLGVETLYGVIYPPQVGLIGFGKIMEQPWAESGMLTVRPVLMATLAADHRATDGRRGAQFLDALNRHLQEPLTL